MILKLIATAGLPVRRCSCRDLVETGLRFFFFLTDTADTYDTKLTTKLGGRTGLGLVSVYYPCSSFNCFAVPLVER